MRPSGEATERSRIQGTLLVRSAIYFLQLDRSIGTSAKTRETICRTARIEEMMSRCDSTPRRARSITSALARAVRAARADSSPWTRSIISGAIARRASTSSRARMLRNGLFRRDAVCVFAWSSGMMLFPPRFQKLADTRKNAPRAIAKLFALSLTIWKPWTGRTALRRCAGKSRGPAARPDAIPPALRWWRCRRHSEPRRLSLSSPPASGSSAKTASRRRKPNGRR